MKKFILIALTFLFFNNVFSQIVSVETGMAANATPQFCFGPIVNAQYHLKGGNYVGLGVLLDNSRQRETYITRFGTNLNRRWYFNSGVGFVNDWSKSKRTNDYECVDGTYPRTRWLRISPSDGRNDWCSNSLR